MTRPQPRKSALAGLSPITPPSSEENERKTDHHERAEKVTVLIPADLAGRARSAYWSTAVFTQTTSFSAWISGAIADKLAEAERQYNGGEPFEPINSGVIPTGRRLATVRAVGDEPA